MEKLLLSSVRQTKLELEFLGSIIELGTFCFTEHISENTWKLPQLLNAFHTQLHEMGSGFSPFYKQEPWNQG